jgi:hypothetical protein
MTAGLLYGSFDLLTADLYAIGDGFSLGSPKVETTQLASLLLDGEIITGDRSGNRELPFHVRLTGTTPAELATKEANLVAETVKARNTITWTSPSATVATVFDTFRAELVLLFDDVDETFFCRTYSLTIPALPFARSAAKVAETIAAGTASDTQVNAADSASGWTYYLASGGTGAATLDTGHKYEGTGSVFGTVLLADPNEYVDLELTGSFDFTTQQYLSLDTGYTTSSASYWPRGWEPTAVLIDGVSAAKVGRQYLDGSWRKTVWKVPTAGVAATIRVRFPSSTQAFGGFTDGSTSIYWHVDDLRKSANIGSFLGSTRQFMSFFDVVGSVRAPADLTVKPASGTTTLGKTIVYSSNDLEDGYCPAIGMFSATGGVAAANNISGQEYSGGNFDVPAEILHPGSYLVMMRAKRASTGEVTITASAQMRNPSGVSVGPTVSTAALYNFASTSTYYLIPIGVLHLPAAEVSGSGWKCRINIDQAMTFDEVWLFNLEGALTVVDLDPSGAIDYSRLFIEAPSAAHPRGRLMVGDQDNLADAIAAETMIFADAQHHLTPSRSAVYVANVGVTNPVLEVAYHPRWHTTAGS